MRIDPILIAAAALLAAALVAPAPRAHADDAVLERLSRIARGQWGAPRSVPRSAVPYAAEIRAAALRHGISPSLLAALVRAESAFDRLAVSRVGARGLGQLMPDTARELGVRDVYDPEQNLDGAARYLARQYADFGEVRRALAAYNAGAKAAARPSERWPRETRSYVANVMRFEREYRARSLP